MGHDNRLTRVWWGGNQGQQLDFDTGYFRFFFCFFLACAATNIKDANTYFTHHWLGAMLCREMRYSPIQVDRAVLQYRYSDGSGKVLYRETFVCEILYISIYWNCTFGHLRKYAKLDAVQWRIHVPPFPFSLGASLTKPCGRLGLTSNRNPSMYSDHLFTLMPFIAWRMLERYFHLIKLWHIADMPS